MKDFGEFESLSVILATVATLLEMLEGFRGVRSRHLLQLREPSLLAACPTAAARTV